MTSQLGTTFLIIIAALVLRGIASILIDKLVASVPKQKTLETDAASDSRIKTIGTFLKNAASICIFGASAISLLSEWGVDTTPILTGAGVVGLAVGIGSQALVRDFVNGFFLILENQYNVGDKLKVAGLEGIVKELNIRYTILESSDGIIHSIPNSQISVISKLSNVKVN